MLQTALALATPLKMLKGLELGRLRMHADDYRTIALAVQTHLDKLPTEELIAMARHASGPLGEMAEASVFDRAFCLVLGERHDRVETERVFDALLRRLRGLPPS